MHTLIDSCNILLFCCVFKIKDYFVFNVALGHKPALDSENEKMN